MFKLIEEKLNDLSQIKLLNKDSGEFVSVVPQFGANLNELTLRKGNHLYSILDGNKSLPSFHTIRVFNGAKLFPFPNRIEKGIYEFEGQKYHLPINFEDEGNSIHGFVYNKFFDLKETQLKSDSITATFQYNYPGNLKGYPFSFEIEIKYTLHLDSGFSATTTVTNNSKHSMPFGDGWHPFLKIGENKIDDVLLKFSSKDIFVTNKNLIPIGKKSFSKFKELSKIGDYEFDNCFSLSSSNGMDSVELYDQHSNVKIVLWFESAEGKYNYLQVYIPPERNAIAIEPMTCGINAFNNKIGLQVLEPGDQYFANFGIKLQ